jgi:hypothetical protein
MKSESSNKGKLASDRKSIKSIKNYIDGQDMVLKLSSRKASVKDRNSMALNNNKDIVNVLLIPN